MSSPHNNQREHLADIRMKMAFFLVFCLLADVQSALAGKVSFEMPSGLCPPPPPPLSPPPQLCASPPCQPMLPQPPPYLPNVVILPEKGSGNSSYGTTIAIVAGMLLVGTIFCFLGIYLCRTARTKAPLPPPPPPPLQMVEASHRRRQQEREEDRVPPSEVTVALPTPSERRRPGQILRSS